MKKVKGFVGKRLREAREARELTAVALADVLGVTKQAISKLEREQMEPSLDLLRDISSSLHLPTHFFYRQIEPHEELGVLFFRSQATATKRARTRAKRRFNWLRMVARYLSHFVDFPGLDFPALEFHRNPLQLSDEYVESAATAARRHWGLGDGPISNIAWLLENKGVIVARHEFSAEKLDAFSEWRLGRHPYIVVSCDKRSAARTRFDLAHELGHLLLHREVTSDEFENRTTYAEMERQANLFALAFLLPEEAFSESFYIPAPEALIPLKSQWRVSIQAMIQRARQLELISEFEQRRAFINISRRGWRKREPLDDELPPDEPRLLARAVDLILQNGLATPQDLEVQIALSREDIETVVGLPRGTFERRDLNLDVLNRNESRPSTIKFPARDNSTDF